jgi:hypothetical protein
MRLRCLAGAAALAWRRAGVGKVKLLALLLVLLIIGYLVPIVVASAMGGQDR